MRHLELINALAFICTEYDLMQKGPTGEEPIGPVTQREAQNASSKGEAEAKPKSLTGSTQTLGAME